MKMKKSEAERIYRRVKPYLHHVWKDNEGRMYQRSGDRPEFMREAIAWLPNTIDKEDGEYVLQPIIDPMTFEEFAEKFNWEVEDDTQ